MTRSFTSLFIATGLLAACQNREQPAPATVAEPAPLAAASLAAPAASGEAACGAHGPMPGAHACGEQAEGAGPTGAKEASCGDAEPGACGACGAAPGAAPEDRVEQTVDPATGAQIARVGAPLRGVPTVTVAALLAHPSDYAGKTVRVEGEVTAMCHHRRGWFAVQQAGAPSGQAVRVFGAPSFLVPAGSIGRTARTEGTVELIDVPESARAHLAAEHGLREGPDAGKAVVVRATGAEFI